MSIKDKLIKALENSPDSIVLRHELSALGGRTQVTDSLRDLVASGFLTKPGLGIYVKNEHRQYKGLYNSDRCITVVKEIFKKLDTPVKDIKIDHIAGQDICIVDIGAQRVSRKLEINGIPIRYSNNQKISNGDYLLSQDVDDLPTKGVRKFIEKLAAAHGIQYQRTGLDDFAESVTRLAGDEIELDITEKLLIALKKKDLISGRQLARLMTNYMREVKNVRSVRRL
ncbi:hypothetical protein KGP17_24690 [Serratia sp. JSRIV001]|jgi:hypothetical protein|uniref:hypothetical protein n=1 Tax=Serratia TaxID=613 RepID=UPI000BA26F0B|nr:MULTISPECIES: hypothetical protein [Serratia]NXZ88117.1 hypothetical protein [Serratia fonticola]PAA95990.1 hypothetical protein CJJ13_19235 [Serratia fonticola]QIP91402.1 hypothetical protein HAP32_01921 [Serratia fonticola]UAN45532.1 hypothetical protein KGP17_24690 [Serratia sp. JSRIV001]UAN51010.1 hypothetical protein KGP26_25535 [Serratia sp. JSRIV002]